MADSIKVDNKVNKVKNDKTKAQESELESLKKQKAEADTKAKQKQKELDELEKQRKKQEAEKLKLEQENKEKAAALAVGAIGAIGGAVKKSKPSFKTFLSGMLVGLIVGFILAIFIGFGVLNPNAGNNIPTQEVNDTVLTHTELEFENVILGKAQEHQELIVMEQPLEVSSTITKSGLGNLDIFSKVKNVSYAGKGLYTVDMSKIDADHIDVDLDKKTVTITIPHTVLQEVILDVDNIKFEDTEKGLLAFGDLKLTAEEQNTIEKSVRETMSQTLNSKDLFEQADEFAKLKTWQIFQPLVTALSPEFVVEMIIK